MQIKVISLSFRQDRKDRFTEKNQQFLEGFDWSFFNAIEGKKLTYDALLSLDFDTDHWWRDPILKRKLTWGEIGCFLSHYKLWEECVDSGEPMLIMEDDAVLKQHLPQEIIKSEFTYLCYHEMMPGCGDVRYPYWTAAYALTPEAAQTLLDTDIDKNIIPVDEYLPRMTDKLNMSFYDLASQTPRSVTGTDIEPHDELSLAHDFKTHVLTCGDDAERMTMLTQSSEELGVFPTNILKDAWHGGTMAGPGGGQKINELIDYIEREHLPDHDVILFTDAFDVFYGRKLDIIVGRFLGFNSDLVFAAEKYLWPDKTLQFPPSTTPFRYLNSGCFIGRVGEIKRVCSLLIKDEEDDQLYLQKQFLTGRFSIALDVEQYIFMTNSEDACIKKGRLNSPSGGCYSCIYHGNGGEAAKSKLNSLYRAFFPQLAFAYVTPTQYEVIGNEMLLIDFMTESQCQEWIDIGEKHGGWAPHPNDKFPSHDIHLKKLGLWDEMDAWWNKIAAPVFEQYWLPTQNHHLRKAFLMRYCENTQKTLGLHNDASMVTGSVKLNDDYEGATLYFPRHGVTNKDVPIGKMILFPGQVTHGHYVDELTAGTKYSLTLWSARYNGDLLES